MSFFQFRLSSLFLVVTIVALFCAALKPRWRVLSETIQPDGYILLHIEHPNIHWATLNPKTGMYIIDWTYSDGSVMAIYSDLHLASAIRAIERWELKEQPTQTPVE